MNTREKIIAYLQKHADSRPADLLHMLKISEVAFYKQIKKLIFEGKIEKIGNGPHVVYRLVKVPTPQSIKNDVVLILRKNQVKKAAFFGSFARGDNRPDSDIDLLVDLGAKKSLLDLIGLEQDLEDKFKKDFDIVTYNSLNPKIKNYVYQDLIQII